MKTSRPRGNWRMWGAVVVLLAACGEARAFYWFGWPGSQVPTEFSLVTPPVPPVTNTPGTPKTPAGPPVPVDKPPIGPPEQTPEPSTALIGLIGLGTLAARRWAKNR